MYSNNVLISLKKDIFFLTSVYFVFNNHTLKQLQLVTLVKYIKLVIIMK